MLTKSKILKGICNYNSFPCTCLADQIFRMTIDLNDLFLKHGNVDCITGTKKYLQFL